MGRRDDDYDEYEEDDFGSDRREEPEPGTCPNCGSRRSSKVSFTWWGGLIGPKVFNLVKCGRCAQQYNEKTGTAIGTGHIVVYSLVVPVVFGGIFFVLFG